MKLENDQSLTPFQNWILLQLYDGGKQSPPTLLRNCCDTAITEELLKKEQVYTQLEYLDEIGFVRPNLRQVTDARKDTPRLGGEYYNPEVGYSDYASEVKTLEITGTGILYVRVNLFKPITDLIDRKNFKTIYNNLKESPLKEALREEYEATESDKTKLSEKLRKFALQRMASYMQFLNHVVDITSKFPQ